MTLDFLFLIATYNRREKTVAFISQAAEQCRRDGKSCAVVVVDNNSNDGTAETLASLDTEILLISTPRDMFWAESMNMGFQQIVARGIEYNYLLAANDDVTLHENALSLMQNSFETLVPNHENSVLVAPFSDSSGNEFTYGGQRVLFPLLKSALRPLGEVADIASCDSFNMNLVMLPKTVINRYGFIDHHFIHGLGDFDYGLRLTKKGVSIYQLPGFLGWCDRNSFKNSPFDADLSFRGRIARLFSKKYFPFPQVFRYTLRHSGLLCVVHIFYIYLSPFFLQLKEFNKRE